MEDSAFPNTEVGKDEEELELTLNEKLKKYNPEFPEVELVFYFGAHFTEADVEDMKPILDISDIFIPEIVGYGEDDLSLLQKGCFGLIPKEEIINEYPTNSPFYRALIAELYNSDKYIGFIDLARGDPLLGETIKVINESDPIKNETDLDQAKIRYLENTKKLVNLILKREKMIVDRLPKEIVKITKKFGNLLGKEQLRCLVFMGTDHNSLYYENFQSDPDAVPFQEKAEYPGFNSKLMMLIRKGKEPGESLILRAMFEIEIQGYLVPKFRHSGISGKDMIGYIKRLINIFSDAELGNVFERKNEGFINVWREKMEEKGFKLADTKEGLLKFIKK